MSSGYLRGSGTDVGELPLKILLQGLEALKCDLELVWGVKRCWVVPHGDVEQGDGSHVAVCGR